MTVRNFSFKSCFKSIHFNKSFEKKFCQMMSIFSINKFSDKTVMVLGEMVNLQNINQSFRHLTFRLTLGEVDICNGLAFWKLTNSSIILSH